MTTAATSTAGVCASADKLGQASSAVPKKMIRSGDMNNRQKEKGEAQKKKMRPGFSALHSGTGVPPVRFKKQSALSNQKLTGETPVPLF